MYFEILRIIEARVQSKLWSFFNWKFLYRQRSSSVETISGEDDIVEMSMDESSNEKEETQQEAGQVQEESSEMQQEASEMQQEESQMQKKSSVTESPEQQSFLYTIGLITKSKCIELQNRRVERKRRSTANPHFVYSMLEQPSVSVHQCFCYYISTCFRTQIA